MSTAKALQLLWFLMSAWSLAVKSCDKLWAMHVIQMGQITRPPQETSVIDHVLMEHLPLWDLPTQQDMTQCDGWLTMIQSYWQNLQLCPRNECGKYLKRVRSCSHVLMMCGSGSSMTQTFGNTHLPNDQHFINYLRLIVLLHYFIL